MPCLWAAWIQYSEQVGQYRQQAHRDTNGAQMLWYIRMPATNPRAVSWSFGFLPESNIARDDIAKSKISQMPG